MGWNRNFVDYLSEKNEFLRALRAKDAWIRYGKDIVQGIKISPELIYQMVIVFGWNINQEQLGSNLLQAQHLDCVKVHVLAPYQATTKTCEVDQVAFDTILKTINK